MPKDSKRAKPAPTLVGRWRNAGDTKPDDRYPAEITFAGATYRGSRAPDQGFIWWDAGTYELRDGTTLVISTATDELVTYRVNLRGKRLVVTDAAGGSVTYERLEAPPPS